MNAGNLLPSRANARLSAIYDLEDQAAVLVRSTMDRINSLSAQIAMAGEDAADTTPWRDELVRLNANRAHQQERARHAAALAAHVREYVAGLSRRVDVSIEDAPPLKIEKLRKGQSIRAAIDRTREEIRSMKGNVQALRLAALPLADQKLLAKRFVDALRTKGKPRIVAEHGREFEAHFFETSWAAGDLAAFAAWMDDGKALLAAFERDLAAQPPPPLALRPEEKAERLAQARDDLLNLERAEETLIQAFEAEGATLDRREDADPRALLSINVTRRSSVAA